jgi:polar amino acid transport system substrate-binding protein
MHEFVDQKTQSRYFWQGRCEVIVIDRTIFEWMRKSLSAELDTSAEVTYHDIFKAKTNYQVRFASRSLRDKFNVGLRALHASGDYDRIVTSYQVSRP